MDITLCSHKSCPHAEFCKRKMDSDDPYRSWMKFPLRDGHCSYFMPRDGIDLGRYYRVIPPPIVGELEIVLEPREVEMGLLCFGCGEISRNLAHVKTAGNYIELCGNCVDKLDAIGFKSKTIKPFSFGSE